MTESFSRLIGLIEFSSYLFSASTIDTTPLVPLPTNSLNWYAIEIIQNSLKSIPDYCRFPHVRNELDIQPELLYRFPGFSIKSVSLSASPSVTSLVNFRRHPILGLEARIEAAASRFKSQSNSEPPLGNDELQQCTIELAKLTKSLGDATGSLPGYDQRQYELVCT